MSSMSWFPGTTSIAIPLPTSRPSASKNPVWCRSNQSSLVRALAGDASEAGRDVAAEGDGGGRVGSGRRGRGQRRGEQHARTTEGPAEEALNDSPVEDLLDDPAEHQEDGGTDGQVAPVVGRDHGQ